MKKSGIMRILPFLPLFTEGGPKLMENHQLFSDLPADSSVSVYGNHIFIPQKHTVETYRGQQRRALKKRRKR